MPTFLELLGERDRLKDQVTQLRAVRLVAESDDWSSADPLATGNTIAAGLGSAANDLLVYGAIGRHSARPGSRQHGCLPPFYYTEMQHWEFVEAARILEALCPTAACILDVLTQFAVFTGFEYTIVDKEPPEVEQPEGDEPAPKRPENPLVTKAQDVLDKWLDDVNWYQWEREIFRRTIRDGEAFLHFDESNPTAAGLPRLRSIEPEQVREPQNRTAVNRQLSGTDGTSWRFGILTDRDDTSIPLGYWVVSQYNDAKNIGEYIDADDMIHVKSDWIDRQAKRGVSDFFCVVNDIPGTKKLLRSLRESAAVQANIAWVVEHPEGMAISPMGGGAPITTRSGGTSAAKIFDGPEIVDVVNGTKYTAGPLAGTGQSETLIQVLQAALRNIGARWQMPEGLISGDASNANLASALVAEAPFLHAMQCRQWYYRCQYKRLLERLLDRAAVEGIIGGGEALLDQVEVSVEMPPVVPRKATEETDRNATLNERGILSNQSWSAREGLDFDEEQANIAQDPIVPPSIMLGMDNGDEADDDTAKNDPSKSNEGERVN